MKSEFWIKSPGELIRVDNISDLWPTKNMGFSMKLNAISRLIIVISLFGFLITKNATILVLALVTLGIIVILYYNKKNKNETFSNIINNKNNTHLNPSNFYNSNWKNPFGNVLLPEINENPNRKMAPPAFDTNIKNTIDTNTKNMVKELNNSNETIDKRLFADIGDNFQFDQSMISFNSNPITTVPNDQKGFAEYCYGNMSSCKDNIKSCY